MCYWINQSINQSKHIQLRTLVATIRCYFPVASGFCVLLNQSINQSKHIQLKTPIAIYTLLLSSNFWILCATESINQSINREQRIFEIQWLWKTYCICRNSGPGSLSFQTLPKTKTHRNLITFSCIPPFEKEHFWGATISAKTIYASEHYID